MKARLFFALWPTPAAANSLVDVAGELAKKLGGRLTRPETVHLTLAFLGEVEFSLLADIEAAACSLKVPPFRLEFDRLEPWSRQRLIVARCDCPQPLGDLVDSLRAALAARGLAVAHPEYAFKPHVTLIRGMQPVNRMVPGGMANEEALPDASHPAGAGLVTLANHQIWDCSRFVLVRSLRLVSGSAYQTIADFPLAG